MRELGLTATPGFKGAAVVDRSGRLRGLAVPPPEGLGQAGDTARIYLLQLREAPKVASAAPIAERSQFPAVPFTVGLGLLMLLGQLGLALRGRRDGLPASPAAPTSAPVPAAATTTPAPEESAEDIVITLRP